MIGVDFERDAESFVRVAMRFAARAKRWDTIMEIEKALVNVDRSLRDHQTEQEHLRRTGGEGAPLMSGRLPGR